MSFRGSASIGLALGVLLMQSAVGAEERPEGPAEPVAAAPAVQAAPAVPAASAKKPAVTPASAVTKNAPKKMTVTLAPPQKLIPPPAPPTPPPQPPAATAKAAPLKLAPSAAELVSERNRPGGPPAPVPKPRDPRDATPNQDQRFPTHVDHTRGPGSPLGPGTSADRKGMMQEVSGPQQGVIRNRW